MISSGGPSSGNLLPRQLPYLEEDEEWLHSLNRVRNVTKGYIFTLTSILKENFKIVPEKQLKK
jgi:hypothetical protein